MNKTSLDLLAEDAQLVLELRALAQQHKPDAVFVQQLEAKLQQHPLPRRNRVNFMGMAAVFALIVVTTLTFPPLRAIAQEIIALFTHAASDQHTSEYTASDETSTISFTSVEAAEAATGLDIFVPTFMPQLFSLDEVTADTNGGYMLVYIAPGRVLMITSQPINERTQDDGLVGISAQIQRITLHWQGHVLIAAYVNGVWISTDEPQQTDDTVTEEAQWLTQASARTLCWQDGDMLYEVRAMGGSPDIAESYIDQAGMVNIAESMR